MSSLLGSLVVDRLYLFVLGPGFGETTLIRVPPDTWIVIDSFKANDFAAANRILSHYQAKANLLVLTHPHKDHVSGFINLIEESQNAVIGCLHPADDDVLLSAPNDPLAMLRQNAYRTYDRIKQEWQRTPAKRWKSFRGQQWQIPDGVLESLHPKVPTDVSQWIGQHFNDLSSAMLLRWRGMRLVLGADVTNENGCWNDIVRHCPEVTDHHALKVPHHGSQFAVDACYGDGDRSRCWVLTPYSKGRKLPSSEAGEGMEKALTFVDELSLSSLPYRHDREDESPVVETRSRIDAGSPSRITPPTAVEKMERGVVVGFAADGSIAERRYGRGALRITE